jgi:hypothetical protein
MKETNIAARLLIYIFIGFTILAMFGCWLDRTMGWEHERILKKQGIMNV